MAFSTQDTMVLYNGNAVDTTFAIPFEFTDDSSIKAQKYDITDPLEPVLIPMVVGVDYTVEGTDVETTTPVGAAEQILIYRESDDDHPILYSGYQFPYATINKDLDTLYQLVQEARAAIAGVGLSLYEQASGAPAFDFEELKTLIGLDITQELDDLDGRLDTVEGAISTLTTQTSTNTSNIATLTSQTSTNTSNIGTLTSQTSTNTSNIATLTSQTSTNTSDIATLTTQTSTNTSNISTIQGQISTIQGQISTIQGQISTLQSSITTINNTINNRVIKSVVVLSSNTVYPALNGQVIVATGGTAIDITLPNSPIAGDEIIIKSRGFTGDLSILPTNALLLDGDAFKIISSIESSITIFYTGTEWIII